jgi:hypothetical protein
LWESKNAKVWNAEWIKKLKDDQGLVKADSVIIATSVLPEGIIDFGFRDGVWITSLRYAIALATILRQQLLEINRIKLSVTGKDQKLDALYNYLTGNEFKNRVETIAMAFKSLKEGLDAEKRAIEKIWARREKEIDRVLHNTVSMYGDLEGIVGMAALPKIQALELPEPPEIDGML